MENDSAQGNNAFHPIAEGMYHALARYYSPGLQRFLSEDPKGFGGANTNMFAYALNNPVNLTDRSGEQVDPECPGSGCPNLGSLEEYTAQSASGFPGEDFNTTVIQDPNTFDLTFTFGDQGVGGGGLEHHLCLRGCIRRHRPKDQMAPQNGIDSDLIISPGAPALQKPKPPSTPKPQSSSGQDCAKQKAVKGLQCFIDTSHAASVLGSELPLAARPDLELGCVLVMSARCSAHLPL
jgi:RHS repeat-associated protein